MPTKKMTDGEARDFVEQHLLYRLMKHMRVITNSSVRELVSSKARIIREQVNAKIDGNIQFDLDEDVTEALDFMKGKKKSGH